MNSLGALFVPSTSGIAVYPKKCAEPQEVFTMDVQTSKHPGGDGQEDQHRRWITGPVPPFPQAMTLKPASATTVPRAAIHSAGFTSIVFLHSLSLSGPLHRVSWNHLPNK